MTTETFNHSDRTGFIERMGRLAGSTTWREPGGAGYTPHVAGSILPDNALLLALCGARRNPKDVGPEIAFSVGTGAPHRRREVVDWLVDKLHRGTGKIGRTRIGMLTAISGQAYDLVIGTRKTIEPPASDKARDFLLLVNIGAGWLWMAMEAAVERAEVAMRAWPDESASMREVLTSRG